MKLAALAAAVSFLAASPVLAALPVGAKAPTFSAPSFLAGKPQEFNLAQALRTGPVVLYFFPAAHTQGCNIEAHLFAQAIDKFRAEGATVVGVTAGNVNQVGSFSAETEHCAGQFPVVADAGAVIARLYDATLALPMPMGSVSNRTSYVIAPNDKVIFVYSNLKPEDHITLTLDAVEKWRSEHAK
jgi:thioredoxin-dependent peroxiredoxin